MSKVRLRRLQADQERVKRAFHDHPHIRVVDTKGTPVDRYQVEFRLIGLALKGEQVVKRKRHLAEIYLPQGYPRQAPVCRMLTPTFHPNIDTKAICVGDHWAAGESLANLIVRIGEILSYQSYNTKSPLNGEAARWCDEHERLLPVDRTDLRPASLADSDAVVVRAQVPVAKAKLVTPGAPPVAKPVLKAKPVPKAKLVPQAKPVAKARPVAQAKLAAPRQAGEARIVSCACGRRYRRRNDNPFRCLGCGASL